MRQVNCAACDAAVPMGEAFSVADHTLCRPCVDKLVAERGKANIKRGEITRLVDPTVCAHCAADGGATEWPKVANLPACSKCENFFRNRPYPTWFKISFAVFMCIAAAAFIYNMRYFLAYVDLVRGNHAMERGKFEEGVERLSTAAERVPEIPELATIPNLFHAMQLVKEDKYKEAVSLLESTRLPPQSQLRDMYREVYSAAKMGAMFDAKNYDAFLDAAQELLKRHPDHSDALAAVASAYSCKYAETGDPTFLSQAKDYLEQAKTHAGKHHDEIADFEKRFLHRVETREILSRKEFEKKYPNGWKPEASK